MAHARINQEWNHTSQVLAFLAAMFRGEDDPDPRPEWFRPVAFGGKPPKAPPKLSVDTMIRSFGL